MCHGYGMFSRTGWSSHVAQWVYDLIASYNILLYIYNIYII